jgi:hypothetical protein
MATYLVLMQMTCWGKANFGNFGNFWGRVGRPTPARDRWPKRSPDRALA